MADADFSGSNIVVVGGSSGIGNGIARAFLTRGAQVHVWGTRPDAASYAAEAGSNLSGLGYSCVDVSRLASLDATAVPFDAVDCLVLCQGIVRYKRAEFERDGWHEVVQVNLNSLMDCARKFRGSLERAKGSLIIVSSISGFSANIGNPAYAASKAGAVSLTKSLAQAWAKDGIRVNGIAPGLVDTKLTKVTTGNPERAAAAIAKIPIGRMGTPEDIAGAAIFLASPLSAYIAGQTLVVDGGLTL